MSLTIFGAADGEHFCCGRLVGALSPDGEKLVTVMEGEGPGGGGGWELCIREASDGKILSSVTRAGRPPSNITFTSDTQFYTEHHPVRASSTPPSERNVTSKPRSILRTIPGISHHISPTGSEVLFPTEGHHRDCHVRTTFTLTHSSNGYGIQEVSEEEILRARPYYALDENLEWVVDAKSRRVCWLPPGYVTGEENGHFFFGSSIVMAGKDGVVRKLTFREPPSDL
jgi:hypothetical protein